MKSLTKSCSLAFLGASLLATSLNAATIAWQKFTISSDLDVSTAGTEIGSYNFGATTNPTVNGVGFTGITPGGDWANHATAFGFGALVPFGSLSADYQTLLQSASYQAGPATFSFSGLTIGQEYQFQVWSNDSRSLAAVRVTTLTAGNAIDLSQNTTGVDGGVGEYAIGTFVADDDTQDIIASSADSVLFNAYRFAAIPEPQTSALLAIAGLGLAVMRNRKSRA